MTDNQRAKLLESENILIIFTRYPEAGKTKTRMIPVLGIEGAAKLQRQMTEYTLKTARLLQQKQSLNIQIYFSGGNQDLMIEWLGKDYQYYGQIEGDLGAKMQAAFELSLINNSSVVMIGIDCPQLNTDILSQAFLALNNHDLVLGAAVDGGYYLIGLKSMYPPLFRGINWGTSEVFNQTKDIGDKLRLNIYDQLPKLSDIDEPKDLQIWDNIFQ